MGNWSALGYLGAVNVTWHDDLKRTVIIVADGTKNQVRQEIEKIVAGNIEKGIISKEDANDFLDSLHVNDYAVEDWAERLFFDI